MGSYMRKVTSYLLFLLILAVSCNVLAKPSVQDADANTPMDLLSKKLETTNQNIDALKQKNKLSWQQLEQLRKKKIEALKIINPGDVSQRDIDKSMLDVALSRANYDSTLIAVAEAQQMVDGSNSKILNLEKELRDTTLAAGKTGAVGERIRQLQSQLTYQRQLLKAQQQLLDASNQSADSSKQIFREEQDWHEQLKNQYQVGLQEVRQRKLHKREAELIEQQKQWQDQIRLLNMDIANYDVSDPSSASKRGQLKFQVFEAQESSNAIHVEIVLARLINQMSAVYEKRDDDPSLSGLNSQLQQVSVVLEEVKRLKSLVTRKIELFERRLELDLACHENCVISQEDFDASKKLLKSLLQKYRLDLKKINDIEGKIITYQDSLQKELNKALSRRQGLPGFSLSEWASLGNKLLSVPALALPVLNAFGGQINIGFSKVSSWLLFGIVVVEVLLFLCWMFLRNIFSHIAIKLEDRKQSISGNIYYFTVELIRRHLTGIYLFSALLILFWLSGISLKSFMPIIYIILVWFVFKITICIARLALLESAADVSGRDVKLYRSLKWALVAGGILTMLTVLVHQLPVEYEIRDFFNRLFMVFLFVVALLLLRGWRIVPGLLEPFADGARPYLMRVVRLLSFLIPLTILSTAIIGIMGYVDMAWAISKYEGLFLLVLSIYVLVRGLLIDFMEWLSELFIRRLRNGWLWTQAILRPLDKILRIALIILAVFVLFMLYGWDGNSYVVQKMIVILHYNLMPVQDTEINLLSIVELIVAAAVLFWLARWTREFAYRWVFAKTRDLGLRNSLAAFTQYTTVVIGILIALQVIGVELTAVKWILTALAFGIGFGLRDLARNYVSGVLMLMERPVQVGDLISVGNFEGEVTHIGMRAMTLKTWDHMEVLVPNAETFEKAFTNWTHFDSIVRTVVKLNVKRDDDPHMVRDLIIDVLEDINDVVTDPSPQVFLIEIGDALVEFQIRYYINLQLGRSRAMVRSFVLFRLHDALKAHGIQAPNPQQDVYLKELPCPTTVKDLNKDESASDQ